MAEEDKQREEILRQLYGLGGLTYGYMPPMPQPAPTRPSEYASALLGFVPGVGDTIGLAADAKMYMQRPEERTLGNAGLTLAGILPFVQSASQVKMAEDVAELLKKRLYHGTIKDFEDFDLGMAGRSGIPRTGKDKVLFFSDNADDAYGYARQAVDYKKYYEALAAGKSYAFAREYAMAGANIRPAYVDMKNPMVLDAGGRVTTNADRIRKALKNLGDHDGIIIKNVRSRHPEEVPSTHYVVLDPKQVRSAIGDK